MLIFSTHTKCHLSSLRLLHPIHLFITFDMSGSCDQEEDIFRDAVAAVGKSKLCTIGGHDAFKSITARVDRSRTKLGACGR